MQHNIIKTELKSVIIVVVIITSYIRLANSYKLSCCNTLEHTVWYCRHHRCATIFTPVQEMRCSSLSLPQLHLLH